MSNDLKFRIGRFQEAVNVKLAEVKVLEAYGNINPESEYYRLQHEIKQAELVGLQIHLVALRREGLAQPTSETRKEFGTDKADGKE